jgi:hypothetical protein
MTPTDMFKHCGVIWAVCCYIMYNVKIVKIHSRTGYEEEKRIQLYFFFNFSA